MKPRGQALNLNLSDYLASRAYPFFARAIAIPRINFGLTIIVVYHEVAALGAVDSEIRREICAWMWGKTIAATRSVQSTEAVMPGTDWRAAHRMPVVGKRPAPEHRANRSG